MDFFCEHMVKSKKRPIDILIMVLIIIGGIILTFVLLFAMLAFMQVPFVSTLAMPLIFFMWWGVIIALRRFNIEYEYTLTENELDIDKIMSRRSRRRLLNVNIRSFEIIAPVKSSYYTDTYKTMKTINAASSEDSEKAYFAVFSHDGQRQVIIFEPTEKMLGIIERYCREKLYKN